MNVVRYFALASILSLSTSFVFGQSCQNAGNLLLDSTVTQAAGTNGLVNTTFTFVDADGNAATPTSSVAGAFLAAVGAWNAFSSTTGVQFVAAPPGDSGDIQVQVTDDSTGKTGGCAAYSSNTGRIAYGQTFLKASSSISVGTTIFSHEIGHALGLDEGGTTPNPPSIMNNPSNAPPGACTAPQVPTSTVQSNDASAVKGCIVQARIYYNQLMRNSHARSYSSSPYSTIKTYQPTCVYSYGTEYFTVDGNLDSVEPILQNVVCQ